tara:strand:- start:69847 stop:70419 length:573 start_codon:yes stop_codon:yes gene_type:complete
MSKFKKRFFWVFGVLLVIILLFRFVIGPVMKTQTKKHSPEQNITHHQGGLELKAFYCSPSKKERVIFGELIPYGEVWRTGANEASTFTTNKDLMIDGKELLKGTYSLWTIPGEDSWQVIFNSEMYEWGVKFTDQTASRDPETDVLIVTIPVSKSLTVTESFTISFSEAEEGTLMMLAWDTTVVPVLLQEK